MQTVVVPHPSPKRRRMGHPKVCCSSFVYSPLVSNADRFTQALREVLPDTMPWMIRMLHGCALILAISCPPSWAQEEKAVPASLASAAQLSEPFALTPEYKAAQQRPGARLEHLGREQRDHARSFAFRVGHPSWAQTQQHFVRRRPC